MSPQPTSSRCPRRFGRWAGPAVGVPQPAAPLVATLVRQARLVDFSADQIDALTYGRAMDTSRFAAETGFVPQFSSRAALEEFVDAARPGLLSPERVDGALAAVSQLLRSRDGARWLTRRSSSSAVVAVPAAAAGTLAIRLGSPAGTRPKRRGTSQPAGDPTPVGSRSGRALACGPDPRARTSRRFGRSRLPLLNRTTLRTLRRSARC